MFDIAKYGEVLYSPKWTELPGKGHDPRVPPFGYTTGSSPYPPAELVVQQFDAEGAEEAAHVHDEREDGDGRLGRVQVVVQVQRDVRLGGGEGGQARLVCVCGGECYRVSMSEKSNHDTAYIVLIKNMWNLFIKNIEAFCPNRNNFDFDLDGLGKFLRVLRLNYASAQGKSISILSTMSRGKWGKTD